MLSAKRLLCLCVAICTSVITPNVLAEKPTSDLWTKFETVEKGPHALHQEFEVVRHVRSGYADQVSRFTIVLDFSQGQWREQPLGGEGERIRIFNGEEQFVFESGSTDYAHPRTIDKDKPLPEPYDTKIEWNKAKEVQQLPCGFSGKDHPCVVIEAPVKPWLRPGLPGQVTRMTNGIARIMVDTETGIWLHVQITDSVFDGKGNESQRELTYHIKQMSYGATPDMALFRLPEGLHEVNDLTRWDEDRFKKNSPASRRRSSKQPTYMAAA